MVKEGRYVDLPDAIYQIESPFNNADSKLLHKELINSFNRLIEALPSQRRTIFKLRFNEDLSNRQISEKLC